MSVVTGIRVKNLLLGTGRCSKETFSIDRKTKDGLSVIAGEKQKFEFEHERGSDKLETSGRLTGIAGDATVLVMRLDLSHLTSYCAPLAPLSKEAEMSTWFPTSSLLSSLSLIYSTFFLHFLDF